MTSPVSQVQPKIETVEILPFISTNALERTKRIVAVAGGAVAAYVSPIATLLSGFAGIACWSGKIHFAESGEKLRNYRIHCINSIALTSLFLSAFWLAITERDSWISGGGTVNGITQYREYSTIPTIIPAFLLGYKATTSLLEMLSSRSSPVQSAESKQ